MRRTGSGIDLFFQVLAVAVAVVVVVWLLLLIF